MEKAEAKTEVAKPKEPFDINRLPDTYVNDEFNDRLFAFRVSDLAVELARQAGEEVKRPLSREQLALALDVNWKELREIWSLCEVRWKERYEAGKLPPSVLLQKPEEPSTDSSL